MNKSCKLICHEFEFISLLLVWHGSHVGRQEQKNFSPLRIKLKFHVNS